MLINKLVDIDIFLKTGRLFLFLISMKKSIEIFVVNEFGCHCWTHWSSSLWVIERLSFSIFFLKLTKKFALWAHKFSDRSREQRGILKIWTQSCTSRMRRRPNCYDLRARERRCHKFRESNMARRVMAMMLGVPRMTRHEASTRGPWGLESKKRPRSFSASMRAARYTSRKNDRSLITRNRPDPWYVKADYIKTISNILSKSES